MLYLAGGSADLRHYVLNVVFEEVDGVLHVVVGGFEGGELFAVSFGLAFLGGAVLMNSGTDGLGCSGFGVVEFWDGGVRGVELC